MSQLEFERLGIPTVTVVTSSFIGLAKTIATSENASDMCLVVVPHPMGMIPRTDIENKALKAFPEIFKVATEWQPSARTKPGKPAYPAERFEFSGNVGEVNKLFFDKGWALGVPIIPPTPDGLAAMLKGTRRKPSEVLGRVPPRMATLTVELAAVHALMAGCQPEYMPVLIAALEGLLNPEAAWLACMSTTATSQTVIIVNGPVVKLIGLASGQGAAGKGHLANVAIGHAINLIACAVGGSRPPAVDKSTLGSPADLVCWVFGENEDRLPHGWEPLHVDRGFKKSDSVVTVMVAYPPVDNLDHWSVTPEEHMRWWYKMINPMLSIGGPCNLRSMEVSPIVAFGPEHAALIASTGWRKADVRKALWEQARLPISVWPKDCRDADRLAEILGPLGPESMIPITYQPDQFIVIVAGGDGKQSHYFPPFPAAFAISQLVSE